METRSNSNSRSHSKSLRGEYNLNGWTTNNETTRIHSTTPLNRRNGMTTIQAATLEENAVVQNIIWATEKQTLNGKMGHVEIWLMEMAIWRRSKWATAIQ